MNPQDVTYRLIELSTTTLRAGSMQDNNFQLSVPVEVRPDMHSIYLCGDNDLAGSLATECYSTWKSIDAIRMQDGYQIHDDA